MFLSIHLLGDDSFQKYDLAPPRPPALSLQKDNIPSLLFQWATVYATSRCTCTLLDQSTVRTHRYPVPTPVSGMWSACLVFRLSTSREWRRGSVLPSDIIIFYYCYYFNFYKSSRLVEGIDWSIQRSDHTIMYSEYDVLRTHYVLRTIFILSQSSFRRLSSF